MINKILHYFYNTWIQTTGKGWTGKQVLFAYLFSLIFPTAVVIYSIYANLHWTLIQIIVIWLLAWDLSGGVLGYNHKSIKIRQSKDKGKLHYFHHNLQHIHPLILIFFTNEYILLGFTAYWFLTFFLYVDLLEINPNTGKKKISEKGEKITLVLEIIVATTMIAVSFFASKVFPEYRTFGLVAYVSIPILTIMLINIPIAFQRTISIALVVSMIVVSMFIDVPAGLSWLYPVYFLKLLTGFTAKEEIEDDEESVSLKNR